MIIRSSKTSIKFANKDKRQTVSNLIDSYKEVMQQLIELLWDLDSKIRLSKPNLKGFYWLEVSAEPISPTCPKNIKLETSHI